MRHAARRNVQNGALVLAGLCCALGTGAYLTLRDRTPKIVTVTEYRYIPGQCVGIDVAAEPVPGIPGVLARILKRAHPSHGGAAAASNGGAVPALPPLTCAPPEGPVTRRDTPSEVNTVPEPATLALMALAAPLMLRRRA